MIAARQRKPIEGRMYRKQNFRSYSRNLHEFAVNIISVPFDRQEVCLNVTQQTTVFSSSRCWQEKGLGFCCGFVFFSLSLSAVQSSSLPKQETSWGSCSTAYRKKPANGLQALAQSTPKPSPWLITDSLLHGLHLSPPFTSCEEQKTLDL